MFMLSMSMKKILNIALYGMSITVPADLCVGHLLTIKAAFCISVFMLVVTYFLTHNDNGKAANK